MPKREDAVDLLLRHVAAALPPSEGRSLRLREIAVAMRAALGGQRLGYVSKVPPQERQQRR